MKHVIDPVDIAVGARVRFRRKEVGLTQEDVAAVLSVAYQQVQKYETGANRLSPSRLLALSRLLKVEPAYFFKFELEQNVTILREDDIVTALSCDREWIQLNRDFRRITSSKVRRKVVALVLALAEDDQKQLDAVSTGEQGM